MSTPTLRPSRPRWLDVVGAVGVVALGFTVWLGLWITPPDVVQGNLARLLYIHPAHRHRGAVLGGHRGRRSAACSTCGPGRVRSSGTAWPRPPSRWAPCSLHSPW